MPATVPVPTRSPGDLLTSALWNAQVRDNINKLLQRGHRVLTVAQFTALAADVEGTKGTTPPDEVYLEVDAANGILWHLAYESGETTYKWRFLGGPPLVSTVTTAEATSSTTYADLATVGPSITLPRAGDYDITVGSYGVSTTANDFSSTSYTVGATVSADTWAQRFPHNSFGFGAAAERAWRHAAAAGAALVKAQYKTNTGPTTFSNRRVSVTPVRIRHDA